MKQLLLAAVVCATVGIAAFGAQSSQTQAPPSADPYLNNPAAGTASFPLAWRDRPDFTCFQGGSEIAAITGGVSTELGPLAHTQAKPEAGPFAVTKTP